MPIGRFTKCLSGDLSFVSRSKYYNIKKCAKKWEVIFDQHIQAHGLPEIYTQYMDKMVRALEMYDQTYNGKKWQIVRARIYEAEAEKLLTGEGEKIEITCAKISKFIGFPVRADKCSVSEFYSYIELMKNN